ncbi:hypothetical protein T492DRAFT_833134 [Pavlovales sp. CCMP2436]|nr:hypothetical protein T492DRAFT_833134 [Pavlovales sp. CCMP2436]
MSLSQTEESLPDFFHYVPRTVAPPSEVIRLYLTPTTGGAPVTGGGKVDYAIPCGTAGLHLDPTQTDFSFQMNNNNAGQMTLDGGAHAVIQSINVYFGSTHISSIDDFGALFAVIQDFSCDLDSLRSSGTVRGVVDYLPAAVATPANMKDAYYARNGATIAAGGSLMVALPLMCVLGTLAMKATPLSQLQDSNRLEVKCAMQTNWGTYADAASALSRCTISDTKLHISQVRLNGDIEKAMIESIGGVIQCPTFDYEHSRSTVAPNSGYISAQIPVRANSICNIFIVLRESSVTNCFSRKMILLRTKAGMENYRFRVGSQVIPQAAINCTGSAAEARFELARTIGSGVSDAAARSSISAEEYLAGGYEVGFSLQAFPHTDALSNGISTRSLHVVFGAKIAANNPACYLDIWVQLEKVIVFQNGLLTYES